MTASTVPVIVNAAQQLEIDVDTLDIALTQQLRALGVQPNDMTSNQFIVADALALEPNQLLLEEVIRASPGADWLTVLDRIVSYHRFLPSLLTAANFASTFRLALR